MICPMFTRCKLTITFILHITLLWTFQNDTLSTRKHRELTLAFDILNNHLCVFGKFQTPFHCKFFMH